MKYMLDSLELIGNYAVENPNVGYQDFVLFSPENGEQIRNIAQTIRTQEPYKSMIELYS